MGSVSPYAYCTSQINAFNKLKKEHPEDWEEIVQEHVKGNDENAHTGPAFLPWHREYNKRSILILKIIAFWRKRYRGDTIPHTHYRVI